MVSVLCPTRNHVRFIADAIDSFLSQETSFPFEIIVRDDASDDGTQEVIRDYEMRYPEIVRPLFKPEKNWPGTTALFELFPMARGKYIATCEGDDYWTDKSKLQIQYETLEENPHLSVAFHNAIIARDDIFVAKFVSEPDTDGEIEAKTMLREHYSHTSTRFFRNLDIEEPPKIGQMRNADIWIGIKLAEHGKGFFDKRITPSVYRLHPGGIWSALDDEDKRITAAIDFYYLSSYLRGTGDSASADCWLQKGIKLYEATEHIGN